MSETLQQLYQPLEDILKKFPSEEEVEEIVTNVENKITRIQSSVESYLTHLKTVEKDVDAEYVKNNDRLTELNQAIEKYHTRLEQLQIRQQSLQKEVDNAVAAKNSQCELVEALNAKHEQLVLRERIVNGN